MKKIIGMLMLVNLLHASEPEYFEGREGFNFGLGVVAIGGCGKEDIWDDEGRNIIDRERVCMAFPFLDLSLGYGFTNQFDLSLDVKTLVLGSFIGIKAKYYMQDAEDTAFVSFTGGGVDVSGGHSGPGASSYNNIEWGYAYGQKEFSIGVGVPYGSSDVLVHIGYKYIF